MVSRIPFALMSLILAGCSSTVEHGAAPVAKQLEPYECGTMTRLHTFDGIFLGSQPAQADLEQAQRAGIKTVVNLRHAAENPALDEATAVPALGMKYVHLPYNSDNELTDAVFAVARAQFASAERPLLVHCGSGNRVGALWLAWRMLDGGLGEAEAIAEAREIGLKTPAYEQKALDYVARHRR